MPVFETIFRFLQRDPTRKWPVREIDTLTLDLDGWTLNGIQFRSPLEDAEALGRPNRFERIRPDYIRLTYKILGVQLEYEQDSLTCMAFSLGPDPILKGSDPLEFCTLNLRGKRWEQTQLSGATTLKELVAMLGKPRSVASDEEEHVLFYTFGEIETEFEFTLVGRLKWLTLHLPGPEPKTVWLDKA